MSCKNVIEKLQDTLELQEQHLEHFKSNLKNLYNEISITDADIVKVKNYIEELKDAIHKLKGLDNLEKKNIEERLPASMEKNLQRVEAARLYGRNVLSFSKKELAAYIIHQDERLMKIFERRR